MSALDKSLDDIISAKREERKANRAEKRGGSSDGKSRDGGRRGGRKPRRERGGRVANAGFHPYEDKPKPAGGRTRVGPPPKGNAVKVGNLRWEIESADLMDTLRDVAGLNAADVQYDASGRSQGFAILKFASRDDAEEFVKDYNDVPLDGRPMKIEVLDGKPSALTSESKRVVRVEGGSGGKRDVMKGEGSGRGSARGGRGRGAKRGRGGRRGDGEKKEARTQEDLDKELDDYREPENQSAE